MCPRSWNQSSLPLLSISTLGPPVCLPTQNSCVSQTGGSPSIPPTTRTTVGAAGHHHPPHKLASGDHLIMPPYHCLIASHTPTTRVPDLSKHCPLPTKPKSNGRCRACRQMIVFLTCNEISLMDDSKDSNKTLLFKGRQKLCRSFYFLLED